MNIRIAFDRYYLGLHGLALMRSYPFGGPVETRARMERMRALLDRQGESWLFEEEDVRVLDTREAYDLWAARYDEPNPAIALEERVLAEHLDDLSPGRTLDVGTGTGRIASHLVGRGHDVTGCDLSAGMLRRASEKLDDVALVITDLAALPFADAAFDAVTCSLALTHVPALDTAFSSFVRVLRPGGRVVTADIHPYAVLTGAHAFFRLEDDSRGVTRNEEHSIGDYVSAASTAGLEIERCSEGLVDDELLVGFGVDDDPLHPERALLGLPFILVWTFRKPGEEETGSDGPA